MLTDIKQSKNKTIILNVVSSFLIKGLALLISLISLPLYLHYFPQQSLLGVWFTLLSILSWILTFDLGLGNGLRHKLVKSIAQNNVQESKRLISSAYLILLGTSFILWAISFFIIRSINWNQILNVSQKIIDDDTLKDVIFITCTAIVFQLFFRIIYSINFALQKSAINNFLALTSNILILVFLLTSKERGDFQNDLLILSWVYFISINLPLIISTVLIFNTSLKAMRPHLNYFNWNSSKEIFNLGIAFLWIQIMFMIITTTNEFLIAKLLTPSLVVEYQIYFKFFSTFNTLFLLALTPVWSMITKAVVEKDRIWILKIYKYLKIASICVMVIQIFSVVFLQNIIDFWLGDNSIKINYSFAFVFSILSSILIWNVVISTIANGLGQLKTQSYLLTIGVMIKIPLAYLLVKLYPAWISVVIATSISLLLYCIIQPYFIKKMLKEL